MRRRVRNYVLLMGGSLVLFAASAPVAALTGTGVGVAMCAVAAVLLLVAVFVGNSADPDDPADHDSRYGPNAD
ncbi:DUF3099 domain-containing protein [Nocardiopsis ansamitocini]|uniref:Uncharacterized protein n=1 Tax=Nocardiopsis ansamitocini TaxID=1670832 RepID=A0A9W6P857_9ACTN|nr:DUF3099 domain-containing protein [Nocardiopsis ansamitocini]GLU48778.1 hypothetical protein Nans01_31290 [Nocardiopsis ansamitocini]